MQNKELYEYAIIRIVPKVERGEFINVGVILLCKKLDFLDLKCKIDEERLCSFSEEIDIPLIKKYLSAWKMICKGGPEGGQIGAMETHVRFRWLTANRSTIIQSSAVHPGFTDDVERELERLFVKFVL